MSAVDWDLVEHFKAREFDHPDRIDPWVVYLLDRVRDLAGVPIHVTSDVRPGDSGEHGSGEGVDVADNSQGSDIGSRWRFLVLRAAFDAGIRRIGIYDRHIHLGISDERDQEVAWIGESR